MHDNEDRVSVSVWGHGTAQQGQQERQAGQRRTAADSGGQAGQQMQQGQPVQAQGREAGAADAAMDNSRASAEVVRRQ